MRKASADVVTCFSPALFQRLTRDDQSFNKSAEMVQVFGRNPQPNQFHGFIPKECDRFCRWHLSHSLVRGWFDGSCNGCPPLPDQQMSESGPFQGRICRYGDWEVS